MATLFKQLLQAILTYCTLFISHMALFRILTHMFAYLLLCCLLLKLECSPQEGREHVNLVQTST